MHFDSSLWTALSIYLLILIGISMLKVVHFRSRVMFLLRAFFPSWKFFEDLGEVPVLYFRTQNANQELTPWTPCLEKTRRTLTAFFLNPQGNHLLACNSLLQHLENDIDESEGAEPAPLESTISYQLVKNLVETRIRSDLTAGGRQSPAKINYQFKVTSFLPGATQAEEDLLISPEYELFEVTASQ